MEIEQYRLACNELGYIPDLLYYRGLKQKSEVHTTLEFARFEQREYTDEYDWVSDFLMTLKGFQHIHRDNYLTCSLEKHESVVVIDRIQELVGIAELLVYLQARRVYVIQSEDCIQKGYIPAAYVLKKVVSSPTQILSGFYMESPFITLDCTGKYELAILEKKTDEYTSEYSASFVLYSERLKDILKGCNFTNFNTKLSKTPIILYGTEYSMLGRELASVVGGVKYNQHADAVYLKNYVLFRAANTDIAELVENAFLISAIDMDIQTPDGFDKLAVESLGNPSIRVTFFERKQVIKQASVTPNEEAVDASIALNSHVPISSDLVFWTLFQTPTKQDSELARRSQMYEFISQLTGLDMQSVKNIILRERYDTRILTALQQHSSNMADNKTRLARSTKQFIRFEHHFMQSLHFSNMVDLGCGDGTVSQAIANLLGVTATNVIGIDVRDIRKADIQYIQSDLECELTLPNSSCQLFTIFEVLHHIKNWKQLIRRVFERLELDGYFLIRESLVKTYIDCLVLDAQHALYAVLNGEMTVLEYVTEFEAEYIRRDELVRELSNAGFRVLVVQKDYEQDKFNKHWILCQKITSVNITLKE